MDNLSTRIYNARKIAEKLTADRNEQNEYVEEKTSQYVKAHIQELVDLTNSNQLKPQDIVDGIHGNHRHLQALFIDVLVKSMGLYGDDTRQQDPRNELAKIVASRMYKGAMS